VTRVDEELIEFDPVVEGTARLHLRRSFRPRGGKQRDDVLTRLSFCICIGHRDPDDAQAEPQGTSTIVGTERSKTPCVLAFL
jgi:hypothetical protein